VKPLAERSGLELGCALIDVSFHGHPYTSEVVLVIRVVMAGSCVSTYEVQVYPQKLPLNPGQFFHFFLPHDF
jgi:hypothetical protein